MAPTTDYQAGISTNDVVMSYAPEAQWGVKPVAQFHEVRMNSEGFAKTKSRNRPSEINKTGQVSAAVTQKVETKGDFKLSLSAATPFDQLAASIMGTPMAATAITAATIAAVADGFTDSGNGLAGCIPGAWVRVKGFTGAGAAANGLYQILTVAAGKITTFPAPTVVKAAGDPVKITGQCVRNGNDFQSFFFQKKLANDKFLQYPGTWPNSGEVSGAVGDFFSASLNYLIKDETNSNAEASTGAPIAAAAGDVISTVKGLGVVYRGAAAMVAIMQKVGMKWTIQNAAAQYGMGSAAAQGMRKGLLEASGNMEFYFKDFDLYLEFDSEEKKVISWSACDPDGAGFVFTLTAASLMNPKIVAGGPGQDVMSAFDVEGNPSDPAGIYGGCTIQIDKVS